MRIVRLTLALFLLGVTAGAAEMLFPQPLHLVRRIEDPLARSPIVLDEYCSGNRIVTISGSRVVVTDFARQQITEIDRAAATYSMTSFSDIARTQRPEKENLDARWRDRADGVRAAGSLESRAFVREDRSQRQTLEIAIDRRLPSHAWP